ncbi:MAG: alpha/beta fold hydrolase [Patescibacteria group bacterium]
MLQTIKRPIDVVIIPGSRHTNKEYWYPRLADTLRSKGLTVLYPRFPPFPQQTLSDWEETLKPFENQFTKNAIFIGHSLGGRFLFKYLGEHQAGGAFFVSAPFQPEEDLWKTNMRTDFRARILLDFFWSTTNGTFFEEPVNWEAIKTNVKKIHLFYSTHDLLIPEKHPLEIQKILGGEIHWIKNGRHLDVGLEKIPELTKTILKVYDEIHHAHLEGYEKRGTER